MRILALDIGTVRIGVAVSDAAETIATPLTVVTRGDTPAEDAAVLAGLAQTYGAERIVVGLPTSLRGRQELAAQQVMEFVSLLRQHTDTEIVTWDERLTTALAERAMIEGGARRDVRRRKLDQVAAAVILQSYLDARRE